MKIGYTLMTDQSGPTGQHYRVESAKLWDLPAQRIPISVAVSGPRSCELFAPLATT